MPFIVHVIEMWSETVLFLSYYILGSTSFSCLCQCLLKLVRALGNGLLVWDAHSRTLYYCKAWWGLQFSARDCKPCMIGSLTLLMSCAVVCCSFFSFIRTHISSIVSLLKPKHWFINCTNDAFEDIQDSYVLLRFEPQALTPFFQASKDDFHSLREGGVPKTGAMDFDGIVDKLQFWVKMIISMFRR